MTSAALPAVLADYYRAVDAADGPAAAALYAEDALYAVPHFRAIETAARHEIVGRAAIAEFAAERGGHGRVHEPLSWVVDGGRCLIEGVLRNVDEREPFGSFGAVATLDDAGLIRRYLAYACLPAVPRLVDAPSGLNVDVRQLVKRYFASLESGDFEDAADCFSEDVVYSHPPYQHTGIDSGHGRVTFRGRAELLAGFQARGRTSFEHRIFTCERQESDALFDGVVEGLPNGNVGAFVSSMTLDGDGRIARYLSFYCEPAPAR
jgi:ketosteroid isomerase-like protein